MILEQFFDPASSTYTYLIAARNGGEAILIDTVVENIEQYLQFLNQHQITLRKVIDTHTHADHISGIARLRSLTNCTSGVFKDSPVSRASIRFEHGDSISVEGITLKVLHTPGHTADSCCFYHPGFVFTGDTLLISGTGRTDFQGGDAGQSYDSITSHLFTLPETTLVYPGHDYKGENLSTIEFERQSNPRLAGRSRSEYMQVMNNLNLPDPAFMDVALPANASMGDDIGLELEENRILSVAEARIKVRDPNVVFVDLRDEAEVAEMGTIEGCMRVPYTELEDTFSDIEHPLLRALSEGKEVVFFCAFGERSALAMSTVPGEHLEKCFHLRDGLDGWQKVH